MNNPLAITGEEFKRLVNLDPDWVAKTATADHPVTVTGFCDMKDSPIRALSPFIAFLPENGDHEKTCANFLGCRDLKKAQGTFHGFVSFADSGIEEIDPEGFAIVEPNRFHNACDFSFCKGLKVATGTYPGYVGFRETGVEEIRDLKISAGKKIAADFTNSPVETAAGEFHGQVIFSQCPIQKIGALKITKGGEHGLLCRIADTPLAKAHPTLACTIMTGSKDPADWEKTLKALGDLPGNRVSHTHDMFKRAIARGKLKTPTLEI